MIEIEFFTDPRDFVAEADAVLAATPVVASVIATMADRAIRTGNFDPPAHPRWWAVARQGEEIVGVAMRTAPFEPYPMYLMPMADETARAFALALIERDEHPGGCNGALAPALACARAVADHWPGEVRVAQETRLFECTAAIVPAKPAGEMRLATLDDVDLVSQWGTAFHGEADEQSGREAGSGQSHAIGVEQAAGWIEHSQVWLFEDQSGTPVHLTRVNPPAFGVSRIGPVFTPKPARGHGYASWVVAEVTARGLAQGHRMCLFADRANPTSTKIYEQMGYQTLTDTASVVIE